MVDGLWGFSLRFYADPAVQQVCVSLQDGSGADVNMVLCLLWRGARGEVLEPATVASLDVAVAPWRGQVVRPLRDLRRHLKGTALIPDAVAQEAFRATVKKAELSAEKLQQQVLQALSRDEAGRMPGAEAARNNLKAYGEVLGSPLPEAMVEALLARLGEIDQKDVPE